MKKNSGEKNEREEEFPNGRENEKKERGKKKNTTGPNEEQCTEHTSLQRLRKKDVRDGYLFLHIL